jgi:hypothetical protein
MSWGDDINEWNENNNEFVEKHKDSKKIIDFSNKIELNEFLRFKTISSLNFDIPNKNQSVFLLTTKAISLLDVVNFIEQKKGSIKEAIMFLYTITDKAANYISFLSQKTDLKIIISDLMNSQRQKERIITEIFDKNNVEIVFCHNHSKIIAINIESDYYVLSGSMNAGNNARIESLHIINSFEMYNFVLNSYFEFKDKFQINKRY